MTNERLQHPIKKVMIWPNTGKEGMGLAVRQAADVLREFGAEVILAERALEIGIDTGKQLSKKKTVNKTAFL